MLFLLDTTHFQCTKCELDGIRVQAKSIICHYKENLTMMAALKLYERVTI